MKEERQRLHYLEPTDKLSERPRTKALERIQVALSKCGKASVRGACGCGHHYRVIWCAKPYCPVCGAQDSPDHLRRYSRWLNRLRKVDRVGYLVITFPMEYRGLLRSKTALWIVGREVRRALKGFGVSRGLTRWHFSGDKNPDAWHPHLNVVMDWGFMSLDELSRMKFAVRMAITRALGVDLREAVVNYSIRRGPAAVCHTARYVTRPTWPSGEAAEGLAEVLLDLRNDGWWGDWRSGENKFDLHSDEPKIGAIGAIEEGCCPVCGGEIHWSRPIVPVPPGVVELAPGYYFLAR